jgi:hypothetical protein
MDMIPFGHLMVWNPEENRASQPIDNNMELSGKGFERMSGLSRDQKYTFITMRALAASPLFMGGELRTSDEFSFELITNEEMLACNQNAVMGKQIYKQDGIEIWSVASASKEGEGWIGIFNRNEEPKTVNLSISGQLGLYNAAEAELTNIWEEPEMSQSSDGYIQSEIGGDGVLFLKYKEVRSS